MNTTVRKCPHCNSDVLTRYTEGGAIYYEPCGSDSDSAALYKARKVAALALEALQFAYGGEPLPTLGKEAIDELKEFLHA